MQCGQAERSAVVVGRKWKILGSGNSEDEEWRAGRAVVSRWKRRAWASTASKDDACFEVDSKSGLSLVRAWSVSFLVGWGKWKLPSVHEAAATVCHVVCVSLGILVAVCIDAFVSCWVKVSLVSVLTD
jgi:hypothetical protein